jgi:signal transduction histidine kinase
MRKADNTCCLRIEVEDTGIGIPNDRLDEIFESFRQLEDTITRSHGGTGLGLAICRQLADLLDGEIGMQSKLGAGSCFWLEVPFTLPHQEALPEQTLLNAGD